MSFQLPKGTIIDDRYEVLELVGEGGMGTVVKAQELGLGRLVAIKFLHIGKDDTDGRARFVREGEILSRLTHKNLLVFYRFGMWRDSTPYMACEYLQGKTLADVIAAEGKLDWLRAVKIIRSVAQAMSAAHEQGIIHRDLKPGNIMLLDKPEADFVKVVDFGLARVSTQPGEISQHLTQTGSLLGSVLYMSPEQASGGKVDLRSDIYSLGCVLYEALAGEAPLLADNSFGVIHKHQTEFPLPLERRLGKSERLSALDAVLFKAMAKNPADRYQSMLEFDKDLQATEQGKPADLIAAPLRKTNRMSLIGGAVALAVCALAGAVFYAQRVPVAKEVSTVPQKKSALGLQGKLQTAMSLPLAQRIAYYEKMIDETPANLVRRPTAQETMAEVGLNLAADLNCLARFDEAANYLRKTIALLKPAPQESLDGLNTSLANAYALNGHFHEALSVLARMNIDESERTLSARINRADCLLAIGQRAQAQKEYEHALSLTEKFKTEKTYAATIRRSLAKIYSHNGDKARTLEQLHGLEKLIDARSPQEEVILARRTLMDLYRDIQATPEALDQIDKVLSMQDLTPDQRFPFAVNKISSLALKDPAGAIKFGRQQIEQEESAKDPGSFNRAVGFGYATGNVEYTQGHYAEALASFNKSLDSFVDAPPDSSQRVPTDMKIAVVNMALDAANKCRKTTEVDKLFAKMAHFMDKYPEQFSASAITQIYSHRAMLLSLEKKRPQAAELLESCIPRIKENKGHSAEQERGWVIAMIHMQSACWLREADKLPERDQRCRLLIKELEPYLAAPDLDPAQKSCALDEIAKFYDANNEKQKAAEARRQAKEFSAQLVH